MCMNQIHLQMWHGKTKTEIEIFRKEDESPTRQSTGYALGTFERLD